MTITKIDSAKPNILDRLAMLYRATERDKEALELEKEGKTHQSHQTMNDMANKEMQATPPCSAPDH